jgi:P63C domain
MDNEKSPESRGAKGGKARAKNLSPVRRSEIAREAAMAKWSQNIPHALCEGKIDFAGRKFACAVLDTKLRLLTQETFLTTLGRAPKAKGGQGSERMMRVGGLPPFLSAENLTPFISDELRQAAMPVVFRTTRGNKAYGYDARLLPMVCEVYLLARDAHLIALRDAQKKRREGQNVEARAVLLPSQERLVETCDLLVRSMAKEHIVSLVDRATGYADQEIRDEITKVLEQYIAPHLMPWIPKFPDEFFRQVYRIYGWPYVAGNRKMPQYVGKFINKYIYGYLPPGVLEKLQELNPVKESGWRGTQNHRFLTDTGNVHLDRQITSTTTVMALSADAAEFDLNFHKIHTKKIPEKKALQLRAEKAPPPLPLFPKIDEEHQVLEKN